MKSRLGVSLQLQRVLVFFFAFFGFKLWERARWDLVCLFSGEKELMLILVVTMESFKLFTFLLGLVTLKLLQKLMGTFNFKVFFYPLSVLLFLKLFEIFLIFSLSLVFWKSDVERYEFSGFRIFNLWGLDLFTSSIWLSVLLTVLVYLIM